MFYISEKHQHPELERLSRDIFDALVEKMRAGTFYPAKEGAPAELVNMLPELGQMAVGSTEANLIDNPVLVKGERDRPEIGRYTKFWAMPGRVEAQHGSWDEKSNPYVIDDRQLMHPEELMEFHILLVGVDSPK